MKYLGQKIIIIIIIIGKITAQVRQNVTTWNTEPRKRKCSSQLNVRKWPLKNVVWRKGQRGPRPVLMRRRGIKAYHWVSAVEVNHQETFSSSCNQGMLSTVSDNCRFTGDQQSSCKALDRIPIHPWKSLKVLKFVSPKLKSLKVLETGQVLENPWISFHRSLKVLEFTKSNCAISAAQLMMNCSPKLELSPITFYTHFCHHHPPHHRTTV